jgi:hypothetical protein
MHVLIKQRFNNTKVIMVNIMRKFVVALASAIVLLNGVAVIASADSTASITQSYTSTSSVIPGMLVQVVPKTTDTVEPLSDKNIKKLLGVVVPVNDAPIVLNSGTVTNQQVLVADNSRYNLLVSSQGGAIKAGDYLTVSTIAGIGMKAGTTQPEIIGQALAAFSGSNALGQVALKSSTGAKANAAVGSILVNIQLAPNPYYTKAASKLPAFLSKAANGIANKSVNPVRVYLWIFILLVTLGITVSTIYGGVSGSVVAVGRNPLAKQVIGRDVIRVTLIGLVIFVIGFLASYFILVY